MIDRTRRGAGKEKVMAKPEKKSGVILTDHNTGKTHEFASAEAAVESYDKLNDAADKRGFTSNYTITDAVTGAVVARHTA
jgi:hypothetical protein